MIDVEKSYSVFPSTLDIVPFANVNVTLLFDLIITSLVAFSAKIVANVSAETICESPKSTV